MSNRRAPVDSARLHHRFFVATSGVLLAITLVGFSPSFFLKPLFDNPGQIARSAELLRVASGSEPSRSDLPLHVVAHGVLATAWMILFFVQTLLIHTGRGRLHRKLGVGGLFLAAGVAVSGGIAIFLALPRLIALASPLDPAVVIAEQLPLFSRDLGTFIVFSIAVSGAAHFRRRPETHKHLMLLASMTLVTVAIARVWMNAGLENAMEVWIPATENTLAVLIIGGDWLIRRRTPWVLLGGFTFWLVLNSLMIQLGSTETAQSWARAWMT